MQETRQWYALYARPGWEKKVADNLTRKKLESYCPLVTVRESPESGRRKTIQRPLFTSYVFVSLSQPELQLFMDSPDDIRFMYWLGKPAMVASKEITVIRDFVHDFRDIQVERFMVHAPDHTTIPLSGLRKRLAGEKHDKTSIIRVYLPSLGYILQAERIVTSVQMIDVFIKRRNKAS